MIWFRDCPLFSCFATLCTSSYMILFSLSILLTIQLARRIVFRSSIENELDVKKYLKLPIPAHSLCIVWMAMRPAERQAEHNGSLLYYGKDHDERYR